MAAFEQDLIGAKGEVSKAFIPGFEDANAIASTPFDLERTAQLAYNVVTKLGIRIPEAKIRTAWNLDRIENEQSLHMCGNLESLSLSFVSPDNNRLVTIAIRSRPGNQICDRVVVRVLENGNASGLIGAEYCVYLDKADDHVIEETMESVIVQNAGEGHAKVMKLLKTRHVKGCRQGEQEITCIEDTEGFRTGNKNYVRFSAIPADVTITRIEQCNTSIEKNMFAIGDIFTAITAIAGDLSEYQAIPVEHIS